MKTLEELINKEEPAWDLILDWVKNAENEYEILEKNKAFSEKELIKAQVTTRSTLGAIIYETGGILIDKGWIRILGSGHSKLNRRLMDWNKNKTYNNLGETSNYLLIADDVVGGYFAINSGGIGDEIGNIYYLAPDTLDWENLECGYTDFLYWCLNGNLSLFYENVRWKSWEDDMKKINGNQTYSFYPFLWTKEGKNIEKVEKKIIPIEENYNLIMEFKNKIGK